MFLNELLRGFVIWGWFCCVGGGLRCDLLFCEAAEPPPSSGNAVGDAGAAALAGALEKNTSLQTLNLECESLFLDLLLSDLLFLKELFLGDVL